MSLSILLKYNFKCFYICIRNYKSVPLLLNNELISFLNIANIIVVDFIAYKCAWIPSYLENLELKLFM